MGRSLDTDNSVRFLASMSYNNVAYYADAGKRFGKTRSLRKRIVDAHFSSILM
jgi:hypothetical protein